MINRMNAPKSIVYITRDVERAVGLLGEHTPSRSAGHPSGGGDLLVVTNVSPLAEAMAQKYGKQVITVPRSRDRSRPVPTVDLLQNDFVQEKIQELSQDKKPHILVFKTSPQIESECERLGWKLLNPPYEAGTVLEEKIIQWRWLQTIVGAYCNTPLRAEWQLPQTWTGQLKIRSYKELLSDLGSQPIVQFNRGHTGLGTFRFESEKQWEELQKKFPKREVKVSRWYEGEAYTVNAIVVRNNELGMRNQVGANGRSPVRIGSISKQLTGIPGCTDNPYATVGNDWSEGAKLPDEMKNKICSCARTIGSTLGERGYRGMFGIDVIATSEGRVVLIEINPRQPASATMESQLQKERGEGSMMEWHVRALLGNEELGITNNVPKSVNGFQLFFRNVENHPVRLKDEFTPGRYKISEQGIEFVEKAISVVEIQKGEVFAFSVSKNETVKPGGELLRIQAKNDMIHTLGDNCEKTIRAIHRQIELA